MAIPAFRSDGWLPEGRHATTWDEISVVFGGTTGSVRDSIISGLLLWRDAVRAKGLMGFIILDGSFVSARPNPGDFDLLFIFDEASESVAASNDEAKTLLDYSFCKAQFGGDVFAFSVTMTRLYPQFFPLDSYDTIKFTEVRKGVLEVEL